MDYLGIIINAVCTGLGVAIGNEVWTGIKEHRTKIKKKLLRPTDKITEDIQKEMEVFERKI